jgi:hypothetical protein
VIGSSADARQRPFPESEPLEQLGPLVGIESRRFRFELHGNGEDLGGVTELGRDRLGQLVAIGDVVLTHIDDDQNGLVGQQEEGLQGRALLRVESRAVQRRSFMENRQGGVECRDLPHQRSIGPGRLAPAFHLGFNRRGVS